MLIKKTIAVAVPAYNEEAQIAKVIESMPDFVDRIIIVNDFSTDKTAEIVLNYINNDTKPTKQIPYILNSIERNHYNYADYIVQEKAKEELKYFVKSKVVNENDEADRIILINNEKKQRSRSLNCQSL